MMEAIIADSNGDVEEKERQESIIHDIDDYLLAFNPPDIFRGKNSVLISVDKSFEHLCTVLEEAGISKPKRLTVYEFYSKVEYFEKKNKR